MSAQYLLIFCLSLIFLSSSDSPESTLRQLIVVSRHGIRGPNNRLPGRACNFQNLDGQISSIGHYQNYKLGKALKSTYSAFFVADSTTRPFQIGGYDRKRHLFYGTDDDKNLMSGNTVAQGLYPDYYSKYQSTGTVDYKSISEVLPSIPIHAAPDHVLNYDTTCKTKIDSFIGPICKLSEEGQLLNSTYYDCIQLIHGTAKVPKDPGFFEFFNIPVLAEQVILSEGHLKYLRDSTSPLNGLATLPEGYGADEILKCQYPQADTCTVTLNGKTITETQNKIVIDLATRRQQMMSDPKHRKLAQLRTTPFIHYLIDHMKLYIEHHTEPATAFKTFIFHLASNGNVQDLLQLFGQPTPGRIPFGSFVFFELHLQEGKTDGSSIDDYRVKVGYRILSNTTFEVDDYPANDKTCDALDKVCTHFFLNNGQVWWSLNEILALVMDMDTWRSECGIQDAQYYSEELRSTQSTLASTDDDKNKYQQLFIIFLIVLLVLLVIAIVIIILQCFGCCCCGASSSSSSYDSSKEEEMDDQQAV